MKNKILVVDDEAGIRELITDALKIAGFETLTAGNGIEGIAKLREEKPAMMIVDINMPIMNGFEFVEKIRTEGNQIPVLMLSARTDQFDVNRGLKIGADDYVRKPFGLEELILRVKAILNRRKPANIDLIEMHCGPITIDNQKYKVKLNGNIVDLSPTEFRLLQLLIENKNIVLTKDKLLAEVWGIDFETETTVVDTYISYLRKKLHKNGFEGIKTIRGIGFTIED